MTNPKKRQNNAQKPKNQHEADMYELVKMLREVGSYAGLVCDVSNDSEYYIMCAIADDCEEHADDIEHLFSFGRCGGVTPPCERGTAK